MPPDVDALIAKYKELLRHYFNLDKRLQWKKISLELTSLARCVSSHDENIDDKFIGKLLFEEIANHGLRDHVPLRCYTEFVSLHNGIFTRIQYLKDHIDERWYEASRKALLNPVINDLPFFLKCCCDEYIFGDKDCLHDSIWILECIRYYNSKEDIDEHGILEGFDKDLVYRIREWTERQENDFDRIYVIWKKTEEFLRYYGSNTILKSPAFQLFNKNQSKKIPKILKNRIFVPDYSTFDCGDYIEDLESDNFIASLCTDKIFHWRHDFDLLLKKVGLVDDFRWGYFPERNNFRKEFEKGFYDISELHFQLLEYLSDKLYGNYDSIRRNPLKKVSISETDWINSVSTFLICYLPSLVQFMDLILQKVLLAQLVMLGGRFQSFYKHDACLQRHIFDNVCGALPGKLLGHQEIINYIVNFPVETNIIKPNGPIFEKLFLKSNVNEGFNLSAEEEPIWPNRNFKNYWSKQVECHLKEQQILHGCFSKHLIVMKLPLPSSKMRRITLLTNLSIASILNLFNDTPALNVEEIRIRLSIDASKESKLQESLKKLLNFGLINFTANRFYKFNYNFKKTSASQHFLKLI